MESIDLSFANLTNTEFQRVYLEQAFFRKSQLTGTRFIESDLSASNFVDSTLERCHIKSGKLKASNFAGVSIIRGVFEDIDLSSVNFRFTKFSKVKFLNSVLPNFSNMQKSDLISNEYKNFTNSNNLDSLHIENCYTENPEWIIQYLSWLDESQDLANGFKIDSIDTVEVSLLQNNLKFGFGSDKVFRISSPINLDK